MKRSYGFLRGPSGFTLVEILITIVIIGLLAAMAVPGFRSIRDRTYRFLMNNDARQIAGAGQQYVTEEMGDSIVPISVNTVTGEIGGPAAKYVRKITRGTQVGDYDSAARGVAVAFTMSNLYVEEGAPQSYNSTGQPVE